MAKLLVRPTQGNDIFKETKFRNRLWMQPWSVCRYLPRWTVTIEQLLRIGSKNPRIKRLPVLEAVCVWRKTTWKFQRLLLVYYIWPQGLNNWFRGNRAIWSSMKEQEHEYEHEDHRFKSFTIMHYVEPQSEHIEIREQGSVRSFQFQGWVLLEVGHLG